MSARRTDIDVLLNESTWSFSPGEDEIARIRDAYVGYQAAYGRTPDFDALRVCIAGGFDGDLGALIDFWDQKLLEDAPPELAKLGRVMRAQVEDRWRRRKIAHIVASLGLEPMVDWVRRSISASLLSPEHLRRVADELENLEADGFGVLSCELDEDETIATWHLRREARGNQGMCETREEGVA